MPIEAAMIRILPALTSITPCATMTSAGADPAPFQINRGQELHSAVTDVTDALTCRLRIQRPGNTMAIFAFQ